MNGRNVAHSSLWVLLISGFFGCAGAGPFVTLPSSAFFETDVKEREALQVVSRTQEARRANCQQNASCEEVTYLRGLVALFENREDAIHAFQELRTTVPNGRYAASSTRWLTLLQGGQLGIRQARAAVHATETGDSPWPAGSGHPCRKSETQGAGTANCRGEPLNAGISTGCRETETK
jgi:hypothetical protein